MVRAPCLIGIIQGVSFGAYNDIVLTVKSLENYNVNFTIIYATSLIILVPRNLDFHVGFLFCKPDGFVKYHIHTWTTRCGW